MREHDKRFSRRSIASFSAVALLALTAAVAQVAVAQSGTMDTTGIYQSEVQSCMQGRTGSEDQATCLKEARNAQSDKKRGVLDSGSNYQANARARCSVLIGEDKAACEARMMGYGTVTGSVAGGGVIREVETVVMPAGQSSITVDAKTADPVVLVPVQR